MSDEGELNDRGNHQGEFSQGVGGWAEYTVYMTEIEDKVRHDVTIPPGKVIPIIFLPGVMGSNLRMSKARQEELKRSDNRSWRPDDLLCGSGKAQVVSNTGYGGWLKNASPAQRQLNFDPNETEVEYYHYTEDKNRFDPDGAETRAADARHQNVPDTLTAIPPLLGQRMSLAHVASRKRTGMKSQSPAQVARWRGWSEVLFAGPYAEMLKTTEAFLNNIVRNGKIDFRWTANPTNDDGKPLLAPANRDVSHLLLRGPTAFGGQGGDPITEKDLRTIAPCWYPVHAMGYNFLKSNGECATAIAERIRSLVKGYQARGFKCEEVMIVTHSMGGLLARALLHPDYGNLLADKTVKVLGMYHSVMPAAGAAATYKRMRFGFNEGNSMLSEMQARIFGLNGFDATAILANAPGPLELLPSVMYGQEWLKLVDISDRTVRAWPRGTDTALDSIYTQAAPAWWRLINPAWVSPSSGSRADGGGVKSVMKRLRAAAEFTEKIRDIFHPTASYTSFCDSKSRHCYGEVVLKIMDRDVYGAALEKLPSPEKWTLLEEDGRGTLIVRAGSRNLSLVLSRASASGDETVPSLRSARHARGTQYVHGKDGDNDYEHQASFSKPEVLASMLHSLVRIAKQANWS